MANPTSSDTKIDLVINRLSRETYNQLSAAGSIDPDQLYLVDDDKYDMFGKRVVNVATPTELSDAVNKEYVDEQVEALSGEAQWGKVVGDLTAQVDLNSKLTELENNSTQVTIRSWI